MAYKSWKPKGDNYISPKGIAFPIGMVIITATNINPTNWTYGTWQLFGQGKCLVGVDTNDSDFNTPLKTGGSKTHYHTVNSHNHTSAKHSHDAGGITACIGAPTGNSFAIGYAAVGPAGPNSAYSVGGNSDHAAGHPGRSHNTPCVGTSTETTPGNTGNASPDTDSKSNVQPYITVYFWRRIS